MERSTRTVFAYNLSLKADERQVFEFFSQAGTVNDVKIITDKNTRRWVARLARIVCTACPAQDLRALPPSCTGRCGRFDRCRAPCKMGPSNPALTRQCGRLRTCSLAKQCHTPCSMLLYPTHSPPPPYPPCRSKGFAYVEMSRVEEVMAALALTGQPLLHQPVMVKSSEAEKNLAWEVAEQAKQSSKAAEALLGSTLGAGASQTASCR
jgi:RNA recognition motif-containing protein